MTPSAPQSTNFTKDAIGRYVCNGLDEALRTTDKNIRADAKDFDIVIIGGGTFGAAIAQRLFDQLASENKSVIVVMGHHGNWEWGGNTFSICCKHQLYVIYHPLENKYYNRKWLCCRHKNHFIIPGRRN